MGAIDDLLCSIREAAGGDIISEEKKSKADKKAAFKERRKEWALNELEKKWCPIKADKSLADGLLSKEDVKKARPKKAANLETLHKRVLGNLEKGNKASLGDLRELVILYQL